MCNSSPDIPPEETDETHSAKRRKDTFPLYLPDRNSLSAPRRLPGLTQAKRRAQTINAVNAEEIGRSLHTHAIRKWKEVDHL